MGSSVNHFLTPFAVCASQGTKKAVLTNKKSKGTCPLLSKTPSLASNHGLMRSGSSSVKGNDREDDWRRYRQLNRLEHVKTELLVVASLNQKNTFSRSVRFLPPYVITQTGLSRVIVTAGGPRHDTQDRATTVGLHLMLCGQLKSCFASSTVLSPGPTDR